MKRLQLHLKLLTTLYPWASLWWCCRPPPWLEFTSSLLRAHQPRPHITWREGDAHARTVLTTCCTSEKWWTL